MQARRLVMTFPHGWGHELLALWWRALRMCSSVESGLQGQNRSGVIWQPPSSLQASPVRFWESIQYVNVDTILIGNSQIDRWSQTIHNADILDFLGRLELGGSKTGPGMAVEAEALLNATGRRPRTEGLDLEVAGIQCNLVNSWEFKGWCS